MTDVHRRTLLAGLSSIAAVPTFIGTAAAAEPNYTKDKLRIYGRARGAPKGQAGIWWYTGKLWGKRNADAAVEFFRVDGLSYNRMVMNDDGTLTQKMIEVGFWNDPVTGKPADEWINPLNGLTCAPKHYKSSQDFLFAADSNVQRAPDAPPVQMFKGYIPDPVVQGDTLWISEDLIVKAAPPPPKTPLTDPLMDVGPVVTATSLVTYMVKTKDVDAPESQWMPATMSFQTMGGWYPWMRMGQEAGGIMFQLMGKKLRRADEMPLALQTLINERHPGFLDNPGV